MFLRRFFSVWVIVSFLSTAVFPLQKSRADALLGLPEPGAMVNLSPAYEPVLIKGLKVHPENPFQFDFIVDTGHSGFKIKDAQFKAESSKLIKYFLASMTVPEKDLWVNLSPYEKNRMIAPNLGQTAMGRDMLAQDYILKQLTASLIYPEKELGKIFWDKVYAKIQQMYGRTIENMSGPDYRGNRGTSQVPVNTFNKVWIVADKADVFERANTAYVVGAHLKVLLEEDYLALSKSDRRGLINQTPTEINQLASQIIREIILPEIEKEVNSGKNFAPLRQMFYSMILASWYKMALKDSLLTQIYGNQSKVKAGVNAPNPQEKDKIFQRYLQAYKKGVFNYIKEDASFSTGMPRPPQQLPRKYFSGGVSVFQRLGVRAVYSVPAGIPLNAGALAMVSGPMIMHDAAMNTEDPNATDEEIIIRMRKIYYQFYGKGSEVIDAFVQSSAIGRGLFSRVAGPEEIGRSKLKFIFVRGFDQDNQYILTEQAISQVLDSFQENNLFGFYFAFDKVAYYFIGGLRAFIFIKLSEPVETPDITIDGAMTAKVAHKVQDAYLEALEAIETDPSQEHTKQLARTRLAMVKEAVRIKRLTGGNSPEMLLHSTLAIYGITGDKYTAEMDNIERVFKQADQASLAAKGGIDFNRARINRRQEGPGVAMHFDQAMIARIKRDGFDGLDFEIQTIVPISSLPGLLGLRPEEAPQKPAGA